MAGPQRIVDKARDLRDQDDVKVDGPKWVDIKSVEATADGNSLRLTIVVSGNVPEHLSSLDHLGDFLIAVEANGSGEADYWISVENRERGAWVGSLTDWGISYTYSDDRFPGSILVVGNTVSLTVDLASLGHPTLLRLRAISQYSDPTYGDVLARDVAPNGPEFSPQGDWLELSP